MVLEFNHASSGSANGALYYCIWLFHCSGASNPGAIASSKITVDTESSTK